MPESRTCDLEGCDNEFVPKRRNQKYCSPEHGHAAANARRRGSRVPALSEDEQAEASLERRLISAQAGRAARDREVRTLKKDLEEAREELAAVHHELSLYATVYEPRPAWLKPPKDKKVHHGTLIAFLSDIHAGEVVDPGEMGGVNAYDLEICDARLRRFFDRTILVARHYLSGVKYDGIVLPLGGDQVSGDIHDELEQTNEVSTYESVEFLVPRLRAGIEKLVDEFGSVHVVSAPGNHGRDSKKPRHKRRSAHNADTHIARLLADQLAEEDGITFDVPASFDTVFEVYGYRFNLEHGDNFKFSGTAEIGSIGPVKRGTLRKLNRTTAEGQPFDYNLVGHFHQYVPAASQNFVMNGSLKGYDEYARSWQFKPEPPQQALMVCTPEHGVTVQAPVFVGKRSDEGG